MNSVLISLLVVTSFIIALTSGGIAKLFKAKRPSLFLAFLVVGLAVAAGVGIHQYYINNSFIVLATILVIYAILLFSLLGMKMLDTLITVTANIALAGLLLFAGATLSDQYQDSRLFNTMLSYVNNNQSFVSFSTFFPDKKYKLTTHVKPQEEKFITYSEEELIPEGAKQKRNALKSKTYQIVKLTDAYTLKGNLVRILKKNGDTLQGTLTNIQRNNLVLGIYVPDSKGLITAPVPFSVISKLEVYR